MLICKNCFSENPDGTTQCQSCKMENNFIHKESVNDGKTVRVVDIKPPQCTNCGTEAPGEGDACVQCHFPIAKEKTRDKTRHGESFLPTISGTLKQANS